MLLRAIHSLLFGCALALAASALGPSGGLLKPRPAAPPLLPDNPIRLRGSWKENLHASHTFFGQSAIPLPKGQGYYQNNYIIMHSAWYAPLENVSIGGGFQMLSLVNSLRESGKLPAYFLAMKASTEMGGGVHVGVFGVGAQLSNGALLEDTLALRGRIGVVAGQVTIGSPDVHVTLSVGWGATQDGLTHDPVLGLSGQVRIIERMALITENWSFRFNERPLNVYTVGARFLTNKLGADGGLLYSPQFNKDVSPVVPYVGFALRF